MPNSRFRHEETKTKTRWSHGIGGADGAEVSAGFHPSLNRMADRTTKVATIGAKGLRSNVFRF